MGTETETVVFDTNVLVSAFGFGGKPLECLLLSVVENDIEIAVSEETLSELRRVMEYEHLPFTDEEKRRYPEILEDLAVVGEPGIEVDEVRDEDDDIFLECALEADADYIVSGDDDLLELEEFRGVSIVTPEEFLGQIDEPR